MNLNINNTISKVSYIIPYKEDSHYRKNNLIMLLEMLENYFGDSLEIQIIEQDTTSKLTLPFNRPNIKHTFIYNSGLYNKSWACNIGYLNTDKEILIFGDADIVMKKCDIERAIYICQYVDVVNPNSKGLLDIIDVNIIKYIQTKYEVIEGMSGALLRHDFPVAGGVIIFNKKCFNDINGYFEEFEGWGAEDDALSLKIKKYNLFCVDIPSYYLHLPHPRHKHTDNPKYQNNIDFLAKLKKMNNKQFIEYNSTCSTIGNINKYRIDNEKI
jgi:hypothetical protein